ncbi:hypothetical protein FSARC_14131 [Fusarium sarcochroum]|uniref:Uncharacterized protein n=1 Tax=Fusarium sarcochroum TaxID=1208366 RepID=A0A8H4WQZ9_9HYPO|nr:hypothetical protein FSARC_14131 [Fusarium sarcochroum]
MSESHSRHESDSYQPAPAYDVDVDAESSATDFAEATSKRKEYLPHRTFNKDGWGLEILSLLLSLALFIGMVAIFCTMQNKPLSKWPFPIDISAAIAILATGCTAAMMHNVSAFIGQLKWLYFGDSPRQLYTIERFDEASRGPYGSAIFVFRIPWNVATIGALITILRLGFAPFSQQVISLQPKEVDIADSTTTFGFAHAYDRNLSDNHGQSRPDPQMQSAILRGLYDIKFRTEFGINTTTSRETYDGGPDPWCPIIWDPAEVARIAIYRSGSTPEYEAWDINITECTVKFTAYIYMEAQANGSTFAFGNISEIDLGDAEWNPIDIGGTRWALENNRSTLASFPRLTLYLRDLFALQAFFESTTFQSEFFVGNYDNKNPGLSAALAGGVDLQRAFDNMARSMTDYLRSGPNMQLAKGFRIQSEIFVFVRWWWLIGPGLLELAALIFAMCTIVSNARKRKVPLWKSSALVLLTCKHDVDAGQIHGEFRDIKDLETMAKASKAQLE